MINHHYSTPVASLPAYREAAMGLPAEPFDVPAEVARALRRLTPVERATVVVRVPGPTDAVLGRGVLPQAAYRLALLQARGDLWSRSGWSIARYLQTALANAHPVALITAQRGWQMLWALDADRRWGVDVVLSAPPLAGARHYRPMRLSDRIAELSTDQEVMR